MPNMGTRGWPCPSQPEKKRDRNEEKRNGQGFKKTKNNQTEIRKKLQRLPEKGKGVERKNRGKSKGRIDDAIKKKKGRGGSAPTFVG